MKIKIIQKSFVSNLEDAIENWFSENKDFEFIDIKYAVNNNNIHCAMIIYK